MATATTSPKPPSHLPKSLRELWSKNYDSALKQSQESNDELPADMHRRNALREANKLVHVEAPANYDEAMKLVTAFREKSNDGWKVIAAGQRVIDGVPHLVIVTANGKKHTYAIPKGAQVAMPAAATPGAPVVLSETTIGKLTLQELQDYAKAHGITFADGATKADLSDAILKGIGAK